jgi:hypothetical protein
MQAPERIVPGMSTHPEQITHLCRDPRCVNPDHLELRAAAVRPIPARTPGHRLGGIVLLVIILAGGIFGALAVSGALSANTIIGVIVYGIIAFAALILATVVVQVIRS